tara:strand:+ start:2816 stop:4735 length:1920 start_codon:yes stop_codon:yes gene_type:complete
MPLQKLQFQPGINRETTSYSNEGGWFDCDKVRFRQGFPEKIGGWSKIGSTSFLGTCRALHPWRTLSLDGYLGVGTHLKYYAEYGQGYYDITPIRSTTSAGDVTFSASNGSSTITVSDPSHGAVVNDFVTFSGAVSLGGNITAAVLNQEYQIISITDSSTYTVQARAAGTTSSITVNGQYSPTPVVANASDSGNGGSSVIGTYQINVGLDTSVLGTGWGAGSWGRGTWNSAASVDLITDTLRVWTHDNFGENLLMNVMNGGIYYWQPSGGLSNNRAVAISSLAGANQAPTIATKVIVSDVDRHVIAFGCDPATNIGTQDPLLIRFSDQENVTDWNSTADNSAGSLSIGSGSKIVTAIETRQQILVFTDISLHALQYVGPPFTFGINMISDNITIRGPSTVAAVQDTVYWMGKSEFYVYNGGVQTLPCSVKDYVFSDFNAAQAEKTFAAVNSAFSEVWWFYPSSSSDNNDRYVVYNYLQGIWYYGTMVRTAWIDRGVEENPIAAGRDGYLYNHEVGFDDGSTTPASAISAFIESSQFDLGEGDSFSFVRRLIPDLTFRSSTSLPPTANFTLKARNFPGGNYLQTNAKAVERTASVPVEQFTQDAHVRLRGRSVAVKVDSSTTGVGWRLGSPRIDIRSDGRR